MQLVRASAPTGGYATCARSFFQDDPRFFELQPGLWPRRAGPDRRRRPEQPRIHRLRDVSIARPTVSGGRSTLTSTDRSNGRRRAVG